MNTAQTTWFFLLPNDPKIKAAIIRAAPDNWSWLGGRLVAPSGLTDANMVAQNTELKLGRFVDGGLIVSSTRADPITGVGRSATDLRAIFIDKRDPEFVTFEDAGFGGYKTQPLSLYRDLAANFVEKHFTGQLGFCKGALHDCYHENNARFYLQLGPWSGAPFEETEAGIQPARIKLEFLPEYQGQPKDVQPILDTCLRLGLQAYTPIFSSAAHDWKRNWRSQHP